MEQRDIVEFYAEMRRFAKRLCASSQDAEDVCQEAALRLLEIGRRRHIVQNPKSYAMRVVQNIFLDQIRLKKVEKRFLQRLKEDVNETECDNTLIQMMKFLEFEKAMISLSDKQRKIFECVVLNGMSYADTASKLGIPIGTISSTVARARRALLR